MAYFVVNLKFRPDENERRLAARPDHRAYLTSLKEQGKLVSAGPMTDDTEAILIYDVADAAELRSVLAADPYPDDTYVVELAKEWKPLFPLG